MNMPTTNLKPAIKKIIHNMIYSDIYGWPPTCEVHAYQPKLPLYKPSQDSLEEKSN